MAPMLDYSSDRASERSLTPPRHKFEIIPAAVQDAQRLVDIEFHAFENEQVNQVLSYRDHNNPVHFDRSVDIYTSAIQKIQSSDSPQKLHFRAERCSGKSEVQLLKVVEADSGEVVSFTKIEMKRYSLEELLSPAETGYENDPKMNRDWFALNERMRRDYMGLREHCYIGMLATQPQHQHRGAGTMLLSSVLAEADKAGIEVYLEGTDTAKGLYEKHGFRPLKELRFDPAEYGVCGLGTERQTVMVRGAMGKNGVRQEVLSYEEAAAQVKAEMLAMHHE